MAKVHERLYSGGGHYAWMVWCPACDGAHTFDDRWSFNGDVERPTFRASMLAHCVTTWNEEERKLTVRDVHCHSFLTDGVWAYCADSKHEHAGKSLPAPEWPEGQWRN